MFRVIQNNKIGNILIYLSEQIREKYSIDLYLTKTLKLLYLIDETSVKETGTPVTWLEYKVWENGPVAKDIHAELKYGDKLYHNNSTISLDSFVKTKFIKKNGEYQCKIFPLKPFDDSYFSDYEIELLDRIILNYGSLPSNKLINILHKENTLWNKEKNNHRLEFSLQNKTSDFSINFIDLIKDDPYKQEIYKSSYDSINMQMSFF